MCTPMRTITSLFPPETPNAKQFNSDRTSYWRPSALIWSSITSFFPLFVRGFHGRDSMVVGFTTTCAISAYQHKSCEFETCSTSDTRRVTVKRHVNKLKNTNKTWTFPTKQMAVKKIRTSFFLSPGNGSG